MDEGGEGGREGGLEQPSLPPAIHSNAAVANAVFFVCGTEYRTIDATHGCDVFVSQVRESIVVVVVVTRCDAVRSPLSEETVATVDECK